jgi:hypothetical protein
MASPAFEQFRGKYEKAVDSGIIAAGYVYRNAVVQRLSQGYTTGDFVTPNVALTVTVTPVFSRGGVRMLLVGTNVDYAAFWEFGHFNLFTGRYERVEHWREAMMETGPEQAAAFARTFKRILES